MHFKSKNLNLVFLDEPWLISIFAHGTLMVLISVILFRNLTSSRKAVDFEVIESPKVTQQPLNISEPKQSKRVLGREVFGINRKSVTSDQGEEIKAGNTLAKTPDQEKLRPQDADSLPIPSAEYLITKMPEMKSDVRIPYPAESKKMGIQGAVIMDLLIDSSGKVREATLVESPNTELGEAATLAARNFEFSPALIAEEPVAVRIRYTYRFVLEH